MTPPAHTTTAPPSDYKNTVLVIATGWGPSFGGINAFSLDFCVALGRLLKGVVRVVCLTTPVDASVRASAASDGVEIFSLPVIGTDDPVGVAETARDLLRTAGIDRLELIVGHDVYTGPIAVALRSLLGGQAVVIHHMSYGSYQAVKSDGRAAREKEGDQRQLLQSADAVLAVGPVLQRSAESLRQRHVPMIVPGLADIEPVTFRTGYFRAIAFGRLGGADDRIKQGSLAAAGYGRFVRSIAGLPPARDFRFNVFGLTEAEYAAEERAIRDAVSREAGRVVNVVASPYTEDRGELFEALSHNEVAMMLSWHEGFGLVGWEAIAAGVPLVVSQASGLYALLRDEQSTFGADCVNVVDIRGSASDTPNEEDVAGVAATLFRVASDLSGALARANKVRDHLRTLYTWERCARDTLEACGWSSLLPPKAGTSAAHHQDASAVRVVGPGAGGYADDIATLLAHTRDTLSQQARFATIQVKDLVVKIRRQCVGALVTEAAGGPVLVVGEPGAGKSGAQYDAVAQLVATGADVVALAAEGLAAESLGELRAELDLEHELADVLDRWPGTAPAYLVIDALDAARSDGVARTLRQLIGRVVSRNGRWRVIASIRKYDLRHSAELRRLFPGTPTAGFADAEFAKIRHMNVPLLDEGELGQATGQSAELGSVIAAAGPPLRELLRVPFNLSLIAALLDEGVPEAELTPIRTQVELLDRFWEARVEREDHGGDARDAVIRQVAEEMIRRRALRAPRSVATRDPAAGAPLRGALSANVLVEWKAPGAARPDQSLLAFAHHLLFDYAVARLILRGEPGDLLRRLEEEPELALTIRPSIVLHYHHLWWADPRHQRFWDLVVLIQRSESVAEIAKTIGTGVAGELFATPDDVSPIVEQVEGDDGR